MHTLVHSGAIQGIDGLVVDVEVDISRGIPCFSIVGLPNTAVRESRERVTASLKNSGWDFPLERITVNLAPADIRKEGAAFDLAIATGILVASRQAVPQGDTHTVLLGELALDGTLRRVPGVLPVLLHAREQGFQRAVIPQENYEESLAVEGLEVIACGRLRDAIGAMFGEAQLPEVVAEASLQIAFGTKRADAPAPALQPVDTAAVDMQEVLGQEAVKRALLVAAAGAHHFLMVGPPGAGKTMLARRFVTILPNLSQRAALETTMIYSIVGLLNGRGLVARPPLRAPHHSASDAGMIGGGGNPRPGEVTLAHNGVLFLDELPEFKRHVLETLREPLEDGRITISRAMGAVTFPARFQLLAAMNPCPCGYLGSSERQCRCSPVQVVAYLSRISGPLLDRVSIQVPVRPVAVEAFSAAPAGQTSAQMADRTLAARQFAARRWGVDVLSNARVPEKQFKQSAMITPSANDLLLDAQKHLQISARGRAHVQRVSRTIADLDASEEVLPRHIAEAIQYRVADWKGR